MTPQTHKYFIYVAEIRDFIEVNKSEADRFRYKAEKSGRQVSERKYCLKTSPYILNIQLTVR